MFCQGCGVEAPTRYVSFHQNIGALVVHFTKSVQGRLCKPCISKHFWSMTGATFFLGWWGMISFIITPFILLNNVIRYLGCLRMETVHEGAKPAVLSDEAVQKLLPNARQLFDRINGGEAMERVVADTAEMSGVSQGQVLLFMQAVVEAQKQG